MSLVPYLVTALEESAVESASSGKNIVAGAVITLATIAGVAVTMFDNSAGAGGSTSKTTNSIGQKVFFVNPGTYDLIVNSGASTRINITEVIGADAVSQRASLGLGTSATDDVIENLNDATLNRILKVGAFGAGLTGGAGLNFLNYPRTDIDDITAPSGSYRVTTANTGTFPPGSGNFGVMVCTRYDNTLLYQKYTDINEKTFSRELTSAVAGDWNIDFTSVNSVNPLDFNVGITTQNLIASTKTYAVGDIVVTNGYSTAGDGRAGSWIKTAATGASSQSPTQLTLTSINDGNGHQWDLVVEGKNDIFIGALGASPSANINNIVTAISNAGYRTVCDEASYVLNGLVVPNNTRMKGHNTTFTTVNTRFNIRSNGGMLDVSGITFNGSSSIGSNCVVIGSGGINARNCKFINATTSGGYGEGLQIVDTSETSRIKDCLFQGNGSSGLSMQEGSDISVSNSYAISNGGSGFTFNNYDAALDKNIDNVIMSDCWSLNNTGTGFTFGNPYNDNDFNGDNFGHSNNVCTNVTGSDLLSFGNTVYGFTLSMTDGTMTNIQAQQNAFGGVLVNGNRININNPIISHNPLFGIDIGQGKVITVTGGEVSFNSATGGQGFLIEASQQVVVTGTYIHDNGGDLNSNMSINAVGGTGDGRYFPLVASDIYVNARIACTGNRIGFVIKDNPIDVIDSNIYDGTDALLYTRYAVKSGNLSNLNATTRDSSYGATIASNKLVTPDICKVVSLNTTDTINSIRSRSNTFYEGSTAYYEITAAGSGYTASTTTAVVSGDGSGATCAVFVNQGTVVGLRVDNKGSGYTSATVAIADSASGSGATATVKIGMDLVESETILLMHNQAQTITRAGAITVDSPTGGNLSAPAKGSTRLRERFGSWIVESTNY